MVVEFRFPDVGEGIHEGVIVKWYVKEGDSVKKDAVLLEIETDKAVVQIPSPETGKVLRFHGREGQTMTVGDVLATIGGEGEAVPNSLPSKPFQEPLTPSIPQRPTARKSVSVVGELEEAPEEEKPSAVAAKPAVVSVSPLKSDAGHFMAAPATRKLARELGVDLSKTIGTGPKGLITAEDVKRAGKEQGAASEVGAKAGAPVTPASEVKGPQMTFDKYGRVIRVPMSNMRKVIAEKMSDSVKHAPHAVEIGRASCRERV